MKFPGEPFRMPQEKQAVLRRAKRLEWVTLAFMLSIIGVISLVMGASQTMKAMWTEDILSLIPPAAFLYAERHMDRPPDAQFPYGYRRAILIAFLCAAVALLGFGLYLFVDSIVKLLMEERPSIQTLEIFGTRVWLGWLMIAALVYSVVPPFVLGRMKQPLARELHMKALQTDATINKGDWLAGLAGVGGIVGIAYGLWWADAAAALFISFEIVRDGYSDLKNSIAQLMNMRPTGIDGKENDTVVEEMRRELERLEWVEKARVRLREDGDVLTGEAFVVPRDENELMRHVAEATEVVNSHEWRLHDVNIVLVPSIE